MQVEDTKFILYFQQTRFYGHGTRPGDIVPEQIQYIVRLFY